MKYNKTVLLNLLICIILGKFAPAARAQSLSLSLTPPLTEVMIKPGKTVSQTFTLINNGDDTLIKAEFKTLNENGNLSDQEEKIIPWLEIASPSLVAEPFLFKKGEQLKLVVNIHPPADTPQQDYYQSLAFITLPVAGRHTQSNISQILVSPILVSVTESGLPKSAKIAKFNFPLIIDSFDSLNIDLVLKNTGRAFFHINGQLLLKGLIGRAKYPIIPRIHLSGQEREILLDSPQTKRISGFFLGKYSLIADFALDEGSIKIVEEKVFFALPWKLLVILTVIIIFSLAWNKYRTNPK